MKKVMALATLITVCLTAKVPAQQPAPAEPTPASAIRSTQTDNAEFYRQRLRRYDEGAMAVRRKAQYRAEQRMMRMAALKWFGLSNARPTATATPWGGIYSPSWFSNTRRPNAWVANSQNTVVIYPKSER